MKHVYLAHYQSLAEGMPASDHVEVEVSDSIHLETALQKAGYELICYDMVSSTPTAQSHIAEQAISLGGLDR